MLIYKSFIYRCPTYRKTQYIHNAVPYRSMIQCHITYAVINEAANNTEYAHLPTPCCIS